MALVEAPRVTGAWMLSHARQMRSAPLDFLVECSAEFPSIVELPIPRRRVFYVSDPDAIGRVLQGNHRGYGKDTLQYRSLAAVTGEGLLVSDGSEWLRSRRLVQPAFSQDTLEALGTHVGTAVDRLSREWAGLATGTLVNVNDAMMRTTLDVVGRALFSTDFGSAAARLPLAVQEALDRVVARARSPLPAPAWFPSVGNVRLRRAVDVLDRTVEHTVADRLRVTQPSESTERARPDVLDLLLTAFGSAEAGRAAVRDQMVTLVVAGHETVASALTWALWLVAGNAAVEDRLATEARRVLGGRLPTTADYARLPYARQVLDETLRLFPPAWVLSRRALADDELAGVAVPAGSLVFMSTYALHRRANVWAEPDRFDPGRFDPARVDPGRFDPERVGSGLGVAPEAAEGTPPRAAYLPFGAGPRLCIGREFALLEGTLILSSLADRFRTSRLPGHQVKPDPAVTVRPLGGLPMIVRPRPAAPSLPAGGTPSAESDR
jgi:cytochrome P450